MGRLGRDSLGRDILERDCIGMDSHGRDSLGRDSLGRDSLGLLEWMGSLGMNSLGWDSLGWLEGRGCPGWTPGLLPQVQIVILEDSVCPDSSPKVQPAVLEKPSDPVSLLRVLRVRGCWAGCPGREWAGP